MLELDEFWANELSNMIRNAHQSGRRDVADYLELRARNDIIRQTGIQWLLDTLVAASDEAGRDTIEIIREEPHRFSLNNATMVGVMLKFQQGVRCLTAEAGWTRTPSDGFMRGGALAAARLRHTGMPKADIELGLVFENEKLNWREFHEGRRQELFSFLNIADHFRILTG